MKTQITRYPVERKPSPSKECPVCGKVVAARGLVAHVRLQHKLALTEITQVNTLVITQDITPVISQQKSRTYMENYSPATTNKLDFVMDKPEPKQRHFMLICGVDEPEIVYWNRMRQISERLPAAKREGQVEEIRVLIDEMIDVRRSLGLWDESALTFEYERLNIKYLPG